ncbi:hypothetical protein [Microbacterium resistens]|uniref:hypothetical protein n=1 Tax=Microbacterium resistens TaxID=156977 RepID=UPI001E4BF28B|nr:hypothetical protein [Microbacterium resistens]
MLGTYPLEYLAAVNARVNPEDTARLYDALAVVAGVRRPIAVNDPKVFVDTLTHTDGSRYAVFVSQHAEHARVVPRLNGTLRSLDGDVITTVALAPYGTAVLRVT